MPEFRHFFANNTLPRPSEREGPWQFAGANGVAFRPESTNVVEITAFRTVGGTELGDWMEVTEPFFAIGTNPVCRCYVSASGSVSFETHRRPPVGSALPDTARRDGSPHLYPVLCPLRAHLGMVPEANWGRASRPGEPLRLGGDASPHPVFIADLLCTNGDLRTPTTFEIRWKNTTGLDPEADTDNDGLTDWAETFVWGTDPDHADTDGDGRDDGIEIEWGNDPFDADEDGDGVPGGTSAADWAANPLWAANATNDAHAITITLNSAVPAGASASLMVGSLCIPLRSPESWSLGLVPGELYPYRLEVRGDSPVDLSIRSPLTLKHDNQTTVSLVHPNSPGVSIGNAVVEIRRKNTTTWETLGTESSLNPWKAKIAGTFELRETGTVGGRSVETPITEVEVQFPSFDQITNDTTVIAFTHAAWTNTLADCSPTNRRERGFWIYLDTQTSSYDAGSTVFGPWVSNLQGAYVNLPTRPTDSPAAPLPTATGARYPVASFHCHTPTTYRTQGRGIGPSPDDNHADTTDNVPGIVYDYAEDFPGSGSIPGGHPLNSSAQLYKSLGVDRRPTPVYP